MVRAAIRSGVDSAILADIFAMAPFTSAQVPISDHVAIPQASHTFHGVCRVNPEDPAAPDHLTRLTQEQGFYGVRLSPSAAPQDDWIRGPLMPRQWRRCAQLRVPMTILAPSPACPTSSPSSSRILTLPSSSTTWLTHPSTIQTNLTCYSR